MYSLCTTHSTDFNLLYRMCQLFGVTCQGQTKIVTIIKSRGVIAVHLTYHNFKCCNAYKHYNTWNKCTHCGFVRYPRKKTYLSFPELVVSISEFNRTNQGIDLLTYWHNYGPTSLWHFEQLSFWYLSWKVAFWHIDILTYRPIDIMTVWRPYDILNNFHFDTLFEQLLFWSLGSELT